MSVSPSRELEGKLVDSVVGRIEPARLPGMPIIIDRALEASRRSHDSLQVCEWLALDPILALRVLEATAGRPKAFTGTEALSLAERLGAMEPALVRSMLMSAARCSLGTEPPFLSAGELGEFWTHALRGAFLGRALAEACSYPNPDEAYLVGLLHDFGSYALLATVPNTLRALVAQQADAAVGAIPEHAGRLGTIHAQIGAAVLERLRLPFYVSDAVLLHHAPTPDLEGTHPLVRILSCAETLSHPAVPVHQYGAMADLLGVSSSAIASAAKAAAERLGAVLQDLGLARPQPGRAGPSDAALPVSVADQRLTETLVMRFVKEAERPSPGATSPDEKSEPGVATQEESHQGAPATDGWSDALRGTSGTAGSILDQIVGEAVQLEAGTLLRSPGDVPRALTDVLPLAGVVAGVKCAVLFLASDGQGNWPGWRVGGEGAVRVELELSVKGRSLVARAGREADAASSYEEGKASQLVGLDLQIARILGADEIAAFPLKGGEAPAQGVVVFGTTAMKASRFAQCLPFLGELVQLVARSLAARDAGRTVDRGGESVEQLRAATRRIVHEARNPLSVLKTYLQIARTNAAGGANLEKELEIANQEVDRVARLLDEIGKPGETAVPRAGRVEVNRLIEDLLLLYGEALFAGKGIALSPMLDASILPISCNEEGLKQVLLNLLMNASEALSGGGQVMVCTSDHVNYEGQVMVEISIADNGSGMPPEKIAGLFTAPAGEAGGSARGFGLPTSLSIVKAMGGHLLCRSQLGAGTTFAILLPRTVGTDPRSSASSVA